MSQLLQMAGIDRTLHSSADRALPHGGIGMHKCEGGGCESIPDGCVRHYDTIER